MKKYLLYVAMLPFIAWGQVTTTTFTPKEEIKTPYDSLSNFIGKEAYKYIGQELYVKGKTEWEQRFGYGGFYLDYNLSNIETQKNIYKCSKDSYTSNYADLVGKYFKVLDVIEYPEALYAYLNYYFFKLQEKETKDIVYFLYKGGRNDSFSFPFITVGHFVKLKQLHIGKVYLVDDVLWRCADVTINDENFLLVAVLENEIGEKRIINVYSHLLDESYQKIITANQKFIFPEKWRNF